MTRQMAAVMGLMGLLTACGAGVGQGQQNLDNSQPASSVAVDSAQSAPSSPPATSASGAAADPVQNNGTSADAVPTRSSSSASSLEYAVKMTDDDLGTDPMWKSSFMIESTPIVFIALDVARNVSGHHTASIVVHTPQGLPFQRFDFTFTTAAPVGGVGGEAPAIKGVLRSEHTATGYRLWVALPVASTLIQDLGLAGRWSSSVYVDNSIRPTASAPFVLNRQQE